MHVRAGWSENYPPDGHPVFLLTDSADRPLSIIGSTNSVSAADVSEEMTPIMPQMVRAIEVVRAQRPISTLGDAFADGVIVISLTPAGSKFVASLPVRRTPASHSRVRFATPEAAVAAMYAAVSGPANQPRDWDGFRAVFAPGARLTRTGRNPGGGVVHASMTVEEFIVRTDSAMRASGYMERELQHTTSRTGAMAHVLSTYEVRDASSEEAVRRGTNSVQLYEDDNGWHIQSVLWEVERRD